MTTTAAERAPHTIRMHAADNVAIVANDGGLAAGTVLASGLTLVDKVPQAHKVALEDIAEGGVVRRYNVPIGYALKPIPAHTERDHGQHEPDAGPAASPGCPDPAAARGKAHGTARHPCSWNPQSPPPEREDRRHQVEPRHDPPLDGSRKPAPQAAPMRKDQRRQCQCLAGVIPARQMKDKNGQHHGKKQHPIDRTPIHAAPPSDG